MTPPAGLDEILAIYGDPHAVDFERKNIVPCPLPYPLVYGSAMVHATRCHRLLVPVFQAVFSDILSADLSEKATHYSGIYEQRPIRGFPKFVSTHSWGIAIDLNAEENALGGTSHQSPEVIAIFKQHGFAWGGEFKSRHDPMHFQFARSY